MKTKHFFLIFMIVLLILSTAMTVSAQGTGETSAVVSFLPGTLTLSEMSAINFGSYTIGEAPDHFSATNGNLSLHVFDYRGTGKGWTVTARASEFQSGSGPSLNGATITFLNGTAVSNQAGNVPAPTVEPNIQLDCDWAASQTVATAALDQGLGSWSIEWNGTEGENENAFLSVPVPIAGTHTATILWALIAGP